MQILITDVTEMHQGNYCVAGWDSKGGTMVRPLPNCSNWTGTQLTTYGIQPGATVQLDNAGAASSGIYPHRTEDTQIDLASVKFVTAASNTWFGTGAPPLVSTLAAAFQNNVQTTGVWKCARKAAYVQEGTNIGSLAAVRIGRANFEFFENDFNGNKSLRAYMVDNDARYSLPVVAKNLLGSDATSLPPTPCLRVSRCKVGRGPGGSPSMMLSRALSARRSGGPPPGYL
ncbi:MAG: hypothetical protein J0I13_12150 [Rhizobiales bacterium]|jgi:hypothetical protein|nr:hypothetical protein [Hyphomicrobiales bacterium]